MIAYAACTLRAAGTDAALVCDCVLSNIPADMQQNSFPSRHKEIVQQTEWQYLITEKVCCNPFLLILPENQQASYHNNYSAIYNNSIFHPPCLS